MIRVKNKLSIAQLQNEGNKLDELVWSFIYFTMVLTLTSKS